MGFLFDTLGPAAIAALGGLVVFGILYLFRAAPVYLLVLHVVSRIMLDSAPGYTYAKSFGGLSLMQLYSVAFTVIGGLYLFLRGRLLLHSYTAPLMALIFAYGVSAIINGGWLEFATATLRWIYLWVLIALTLYTMSKGSERSIMMGICIAGVYAFGNQMYSVVTDTPKWGAGMWTYVGTFKHESDICFIFLMLAPPALYFLTCNRATRDKLVGWFCLGAAIVGLYYGSYRSLWIAFAAYLIMYLWDRYLRGNITRRAMGITATATGATLVAATVGPAIFEKMIDLVAFVSEPQAYLDFSGDAESVDLMSGRVDLINSYMGLYLNSGFDALVGGIGPGQGSKKVGLYAHNEYVSALVETGLIGFLALLWLIFRYAGNALSLSRYGSAGAQVAAPFFAVMCVSALGTMPFRDMRAMLAMGLMMGITEWHSIQRRRKAVPRRSSLQNDSRVEFLS